MRKKRLVLWALDHNVEFDQIVDMLSRDYTESLDDLWQSGLPNSEITLNHKWVVYKDSMRESNLTGTPIRYLFAQGVIELEKILKKARFDRNGQLIPKKNRVDEEYIETLFFEMRGRMYIVLATPKNLESRIRTRLLKKDYGWGEVNYKNVPQYFLNADFFNWIMFKKGQTIYDQNGNFLTLTDVFGFSGEANRGSTSFTGSGGDIPNQPATETMISMSSRFNNLHLNIDYKDMQLHFDLSQRSECHLNEEKTHKKESSGGIIYLKPHEAIITIYYEIIPLLLEAFHTEIESGEFDRQYKEFKKHKGLQVIEKIAKELGLTPDDISSLNCFKVSS